jgi:hypothetical protein
MHAPGLPADEVAVGSVNQCVSSGAGDLDQGVGLDKAPRASPTLPARSRSFIRLPIGLIGLERVGVHPGGWSPGRQAVPSWSEGRAGDGLPWSWRRRRPFPGP